MAVMNKNDQIPSTDPAEIEALIGRVEGGEMLADDALLIGRLLRSVLVLLRVLENKNASISRLRRLLFAPKADRRAQTEAQKQQAGLHPVPCLQPD